MMSHIPAELANALSSVHAAGAVEAFRNLFVLDESISGYGIKHCAAAIGCIAVLLSADLITRRERGYDIIKRQHFLIRWICYYLLVFAILFCSVTGKTAFVYFQF